MAIVKKVCTLSQTNWKDLKIQQNAALRTALGCVKMSDVDHLHAESKCLKVEQHNDLLSKQFHLSTKLTGHVNFSIPDHPPARLMKHTLSSRYEADIKHLYIAEGNDDATHKAGMADIHTAAVTAAINELQPSKVLGTAAPEVNKAEKSLPRSTRVTLCQLRSGYSPFLKTYTNRLNPEIRADCPKCQSAPHDTSHLFSCPMDPTNLTVHSLWDNPVAAAAFLGLEMTDADDNIGDDRQGDPG